MALDLSVQAWLLAELGTATSLTDLETRYTRLGTARAVALEVLRERRAALIQQPTTVSVSSVVSVTTSENIKALERQIAALQSGTPAAPDEPDAPTGNDGLAALGVIQLIERPRR
ncbi:hypothetical protein PV378_19680 [Streptomyces scabiei]|uniref:hypothetical protein n=1 Tax=Streptomyces scabiei TaxID=1930 RepID=UPI0029AE6DB7|nr:hypothetical protein [Streptomyces scabiei]MDX3048702.1 hypothetical protein [Streptomyces scabiei]